MNEVIDGILKDRLAKNEIDADMCEKIKKMMLWTVIDGDIYDITNYVHQHPGGFKKIMRGEKKDSTEMFHKYHHGIKIENTPMVLLKIGEVAHLKAKDEGKN